MRAPQENSQLNTHEVDLIKEKSTLISFLYPAQNKALIDRLAARNTSGKKIT